MPERYFMVTSRPPEGLSLDDYEDWYRTHVRELLARVPQFVAAERFQLRFVRGTSGTDEPWSYLTRYAVEGDFDEAMLGLRSAVDSGELTFPDWFGEVVAGGWEMSCRT